MEPIRGVRPTDVQRVVARYMSGAGPHVVAVGAADELRTGLDGLAFGPARSRDGFGRDLN